MDTKKVQFYFFIGLLVAALVVSIFIFLPFLAPIALAFMFAVTFRPVNRWFLKLTRDRRALASALTIIFILVVVVTPLTFLVERLVTESYTFYFDIRERGIGDLDRLTYYFIHPVQKFFPAFDPDIAGYVESITEALVSNLGSIFSSTASIIAGMFLGVISLFYIFKDGNRFRKALIELSPLSDRYDSQIIDRLEAAVNSVVKGSLLTALVQGFFVALGFTLFGIEHIVLWGSVAAVAALLPAIGTGLVMIPAVLFLLVTGSTGAAIGLAIWGIVAVGLVDNFLLPFFIGKSFKIHPVFVLFSVLGGILFFGPVGLFLGPLVVALLFALLDIYRLLILDDQKKEVTSI
ncbi:MAG: AI-2E family transporter [Candidatus Paceibacterota bacterium]|jgi:predicted PurR-regulated permease PerM